MTSWALFVHLFWFFIAYIAKELSYLSHVTFCQLPSVNHLARFIVFSAVCSLFDHHLPSLPSLPHLFSRLCLPYCTESACGFLPGPANVTPYNLPYLHLDSSLAHPSDTTLGELVPLNLLPFSCHHRTFALCPFTCPNSCQHNTRHEGTQSQPPEVWAPLIPAPLSLLHPHLVASLSHPSALLSVRVSCPVLCVHIRTTRFPLHHSHLNQPYSLRGLSSRTKP